MNLGQMRNSHLLEQYRDFERSCSDIETAASIRVAVQQEIIRNKSAAGNAVNPKPAKQPRSDNSALMQANNAGESNVFISDGRVIQLRE